MRAVLGFQILILQLVFSALLLQLSTLSFQLTAHVTVPCLWFIHPVSLFKYVLKNSGHLCFAVRPERPKDHDLDCDGCMHPVHAR